MLVLLYGRLDIYAPGTEPLLIEYNTIGERHLHQPLQALVSAMLGGPVPGRDARTHALLQRLEMQNFKLKNGLEL